MAKSKNVVFQELENLALIAESVQTIFNGKTTIVFELKGEEYKKVISNFREIDRENKRFSIDISGTEFHFILDEDE
jgi:uncharacterized protein YlzI (FlbEa/FlbD family)